MVGQPIAVEDRAHPRAMVEDEKPCILAGDGRVEPPQVGIDRARLAQKESEGVDEVDRGLVDEEPLHRLEIGLTVEIGARALTIPGPQPEGGAVERADAARVDQTLDLQEPGRKRLVSRTTVSLT